MVCATSNIAQQTSNHFVFPICIEVISFTNYFLIRSNIDFALMAPWKEAQRHQEHHLPSHIPWLTGQHGLQLYTMVLRLDSATHRRMLESITARLKGMFSDSQVASRGPRGQLLQVRLSHFASAACNLLCSLQAFMEFESWHSWTCCGFSFKAVIAIDQMHSLGLPLKWYRT